MRSDLDNEQKHKLHTERENIKKEIGGLEHQKKMLLNKVKTVDKEKNSLQNRLNQIKKEFNGKVSDHAVIRYLEIFIEMDIEAIRKEILRDDNIKKTYSDKGLVVTVSRHKKKKK